MQAVDTVIAVPKDMCEIILYFYNFNDDVYCRSLLYILSVANKVQRCTLLYAYWIDALANYSKSPN
jgi:hypothetical protein